MQIKPRTGRGNNELVPVGCAVTLSQWKIAKFAGNFNYTKMYSKLPVFKRIGKTAGFNMLYQGLK